MSASMPSISDSRLSIKRFEAVDKRFEGLTRRIDRFMMWSYATTLTVGGLVVTILKLWP